jgi:hypothetical protein
LIYRRTKVLEIIGTAVLLAGGNAWLPGVEDFGNYTRGAFGHISRFETGKVDFWEAWTAASDVLP